ncbi:hypothetical protein [Flavobacterium limnophilum]|uniref:hypothetical protein n=1 Tax=Flavobacterium limnophilum TaxID=3003262 RepID=UPI0024830395|nr:hypothetical protein [Flavobacterium limnophilum]
MLHLFNQKAYPFDFKIPYKKIKTTPKKQGLRNKNKPKNHLQPPKKNPKQNTQKQKQKTTQKAPKHLSIEALSLNLEYEKRRTPTIFFTINYHFFLNLD